MNRTHGPGVVFGVGLLAALLAVNAGVSYRNVRQLDEDARWVSHTREVLDALDDVLGSARDGDPGGARAAADRVADLTADNPRQQARLPRLRDAIAGPPAGLRARIDEMRAEERSLLREREAATRRTYAVAVGSVVAAAALGLAAVALLLSLINRNQRREARAAAALAAERERFRATFEQAAVGIAHVGLDGRWLRVNQRLCEKLGYTPAEMAGRRFQEVTDPADLNADLENVRRLLTGEIGTYAMEKRYVRKDGSRIWANLTVSLVRRPDGGPDYFISVIEDVSARKRLEDEVRRHAAELERRVDERTRELRDANEALEAFGHSVAHDLRAPVRNMQALADALLEDAGDRLGAEGRDYADRIVRAGRQMDRLIADLLAFSRLSRADVPLGPVDLGGVVAEARAGLAEPIAASGALVTVDGPLPVVVGHRPTLVQVVTNLLENAVKFVAPGSRPEVLIHAEQARGRVRLWVEDRGIGIAPEHRERIFGVFERLHGEEAYPGTGIGLAIVRKGAERTGGRAGVEPRPGGGSRFWVEWPAYGEVERAAPDGSAGRGQRDGRPDGDPGVPQGRARESGAGRH
jgi:PAS domain S-box-containing protein